MELTVVWFLIVTVWTPNGVTQFDLEYETKQECMIARNNTHLIQKASKSTKAWHLKCREWPLDTPKTERSVRT